MPNILKKIGLKGLSHALELAGRSDDFRRKINEFVSEDFFYNEKYYRNLIDSIDPERGDRFFTSLRRKLYSSPYWNYGPARLNKLWSTVFSRVSPYLTDFKSFCEVGCGKHNPVGSSLVMYLNGADDCYFMDMDAMDWPRATEALNDLTAAILRDPPAWLFLPQNQDIFEKRLGELKFYDSIAKQDDSILRHESFHFSNNRVEEAGIPADSVDFLTSQAVLEYFRPFDAVMKVIHDTMSPGAVSYHMIDFRDHRHFRRHMPFGFFHYLTEDLEGRGLIELLEMGVTMNMLRYSEMEKMLRDVGFEILEFTPVERQEVPAEVLGRLKGRYASLPLSDLEILRAWCVIRKPAKP
jgi:DNA-binding transcriptional ArsR family regulator